MLKQSERGFSIISVVIASFLIAMGSYFYFRSRSSSVNLDELSRETFVANLYAGELLEHFRSYDSTTVLLEYLKINPMGGGAPYPFCAHINILDRVSGTIVNADPLADLPTPNPLGKNLGAAFAGNRFYQINVVDMKTMDIRKNFCNQTAAAAVLAGTDRLMVTVGVSWIPNGKPLTEVKRVALSNIVPGAKEEKCIGDIHSLKLSSLF